MRPYAQVDESAVSYYYHVFRLAKNPVIKMRKEELDALEARLTKAETENAELRSKVFLHFLHYNDVYR